LFYYISTSIAFPDRFTHDQINRSLPFPSTTGTEEPHQARPCAVADCGAGYPYRYREAFSMGSRVGEKEPKDIRDAGCAGDQAGFHERRALS
jgi:hypothetical protein